ncbi:hypothetical protein CDL62_10540 [Alkalitalea saponilacus]|nr:hypothetical protein CDL62_10540 [Alkalitalea saponilacus]
MADSFWLFVTFCNKFNQKPENSKKSDKKSTYAIVHKKLPEKGVISSAYTISHDSVVISSPHIYNT